MSFLQPWMLFGLVGAAVPIIIHLIHKRRPRRQPFAAIEFVLRSVQRVQRRWRLKRFLLLAARVLLLAALAIAAARPLLGGHATVIARRSGPERLAIVIDASLSMRARYEGGRSAFERAATEARNLVTAMGPEDQAILIAARHRPGALMPRPTASRSALLRAIEALAPSYEPADLGRAVSVAAQSLVMNAPTAAGGPAPAAPASRIVVLSDLAGQAIRSAADLSASPAAQLEIVDVLEDVDRANRINHGITELRVAHTPGRAPRTVEARVRIRTFGAESYTDGSSAPQPADITLRGPTGALFSGSVDLVPGTVSDKTITHAFDEPGFVPIAVDLEPDLLREDDVRFAVADIRAVVRTLIVDGAPSGVPKEDEVFYLERALAAGAEDQPPPKVVSADDLARSDLSAFDVVVLAGVTTLGMQDGPKLIDFVEAGGGLMITAALGMDVDLYNNELGRVLPRPLRGLKIVQSDDDVAGSGQPVRLAEPDLDHPIIAVFSGEALQGLVSARTRGYLLVRPDASREATILASYEDGQPALLEASVGRGRVLLWTTSIDRALTDLPIRPAFLPLIRRTVLHLGGALARPIERVTAPGEARIIKVPAATSLVQVTDPDGNRTRVPVPSGAAEVSFDRTDRPGHYVVEAGGTGSLAPLPREHFAVNVDPLESDLRPMDKKEAVAVLQGAAEGHTGAADVSVTSVARKRSGRPEQIAAALLVLMIAAFAVESALTARRSG